jgi:hypothetical protein
MEQVTFQESQMAGIRYSCYILYSITFHSLISLRVDFLLVESIRELQSYLREKPSEASDPEPNTKSPPSFQIWTGKLETVYLPDGTGDCSACNV